MGWWPYQILLSRHAESIGTLRRLYRPLVSIRWAHSLPLEVYGLRRHPTSTELEPASLGVQ